MKRDHTAPYGVPIHGAKITTGSSVTLQSPGEPDDWQVTIVRSNYADPEAALISDECPLGEALIGKSVGDLVAVEVPVGRVQYRVISVTPPAPELLASRSGAAGSLDNASP